MLANYFKPRTCDIAAPFHPKPISFVNICDKKLVGKRPRRHHHRLVGNLPIKPSVSMVSRIGIGAKVKVDKVFVPSGLKVLAFEQNIFAGRRNNFRLELSGKVRIFPRDHPGRIIPDGRQDRRLRHFSLDFADFKPNSEWP